MATSRSTAALQGRLACNRGVLRPAVSVTPTQRGTVCVVAHAAAAVRATRFIKIQCGLGRVRVHLKADGLEPDDWLHLQSATAIVRLPSGTRKEIPETDLKPDLQEIHFSLDVEQEGKYACGLKLVSARPPTNFMQPMGCKTQWHSIYSARVFSGERR